MKKLFMFLAVAGLASFGASCSSDDGGKDAPKEIILSADKTSVTEGETVTFTSSEKDAQLYSNDVKIASKYKFDKEGTYNVVAKKKGFKDSNVVKITVTEGDIIVEVGEKLTLEADASEVEVGDVVTFVVKQGNKVVTDATITQVGGAAVTGGVWTTTEAGSFKFRATKEGAKDSNEVTVTVKEKPQPQLTLEVDSSSAIIGDVVTFVVKEDGNVITDATISLVGGAAISGGTWTASAVGTYKFVATKTGTVDSNEISVKVTDGSTPVTGSFYKVGNKTYNIIDNDLAIEVNANGSANLYSDELPDGTKFWFLVYALYSNTSDDANFARIDFAAVSLTQPTAIFTPMQADALLPLAALTAANGNLESQADFATDTTIDLTFLNWSATPASNGVPGQVEYTFTSNAFNLEFDGDYNGLYTFQGASAASRGVSLGLRSNTKVQPKGLVLSNAKYNLKFRK